MSFYYKISYAMIINSYKPENIKPARQSTECSSRSWSEFALNVAP